MGETFAEEMEAFERRIAAPGYVGPLPPDEHAAALRRAGCYADAARVLEAHAKACADEDRAVSAAERYAHGWRE